VKAIAWVVGGAIAAVLSAVAVVARVRDLIRPGKKKKVNTDWVKGFVQATRDAEDLPPTGRPSGKVVREVWLNGNNKETIDDHTE